MKFEFGTFPLPVRESYSTTMSNYETFKSASKIALHFIGLKTVHVDNFLQIGGGEIGVPGILQKSEKIENK